MGMGPGNSASARMIGFEVSEGFAGTLATNRCSIHAILQTRYFTMRPIRSGCWLLPANQDRVPGPNLAQLGKVTPLAG